MHAESLLAAIVESSSDAIIGKSLDGNILSWNAGAERIFGYRSSEIIGQSIRRLIPESRQAEEDTILASIRQGNRVPSFETMRRRKDGSEVAVAITVSPVHDAYGNVVAASKIARDITETRQMRKALESSELRFRLMADTIAQLAWIAGPDGAINWYNQRWYDYTGSNFAEMQGWGWQKAHHPDHVDRVTARFAQCVEQGIEWEDTFPLRGVDGQYRWFLSRAAPLRSGHGRVLSWFGTNTDITEQLEAERRIELLMLEVNHRSKNMLAMIQSLARRSASRDLTVEDFVGRLERRIASLSANQDLLVRRSWADVPMEELATVQLAFLGEAAERVRPSGPSLVLTPMAAETLGMALHELATNALKYGALSVPDGVVTLVWKGRRGESFEITWREEGGPPVSEPAGRGFGSRLITDVPRGKMGAEVAVIYRPEGLVWTLRCDARGVLA